MKRLLFIFLLICPLWAGSCEDEDKLPGSKPKILLGKWERSDIYYEPTSWLGISLPAGHYRETYEFTPTGASLTKLVYITKDDEYLEPSVITYADCSYDGKDIHFLSKKGRYTSRVERDLYSVNSDSLLLGTTKPEYCTIYLKIKE